MSSILIRMFVVSVTCDKRFVAINKLFRNFYARMKSISKDIFLTNIYFKDIENIEPAVKSGVNYLFKMVDAMMMML